MKTVIPPKVQAAVARGPIKGFYPAVEVRGGQRVMTLVRQNMAARFNEPTGERVWNREDVIEPAVTIPDGEIERIRASLPPLVRREARERYSQLVKMLYRDAQRQFYRDGRIIWPKSIENEIGVIGKAEGKGSIVQQVEELARQFITRAARQQQAQDRKRITTDWHGHLSA